jgi:hypothetical protein
MCNTRHVKVGSRSCKTAAMQLVACMGPRVRPTSNFDVDSPDLRVLCSSLPMTKVLLVGSENCFQQFLLVDPYEQFQVWMRRGWRVLIKPSPGGS